MGFLSLSLSPAPILTLTSRVPHSGPPISTCLKSADAPPGPISAAPPLDCKEAIFQRDSQRKRRKKEREREEEKEQKLIYSSQPKHRVNVFFFLLFFFVVEIEERELKRERGEKKQR